MQVRMLTLNIPLNRTFKCTRCAAGCPGVPSRSWSRKLETGSGKRRAGDGQPTFVLKTGTADLNLVPPAWGCQGQGSPASGHRPAPQLPGSVTGQGQGLPASPVIAGICDWPEAPASWHRPVPQMPGSVIGPALAYGPGDWSLDHAPHQTRAARWNRNGRTSDRLPQLPQPIPN